MCCSITLPSSYFLKNGGAHLITTNAISYPRKHNLGPSPILYSVSLAAQTLGSSLASFCFKPHCHLHFPGSAQSL